MFVDGTGHAYPAGFNVTDRLAKNDSESTYRSLTHTFSMMQRPLR